MTSNGVGGARKHPLITTPFLLFTGATTVFSAIVVAVVWLTGRVWIASLVPIGPAVAAVGLGLARSEAELLKQLFRSSTNGQVGGKWFAISSLSLPAIACLAMVIYTLTGDSDIIFGVPKVLAIFLALPLAMCTEFGWRGYSAVHVSNRQGLFVKSVIVGGAWFVSLTPLYAIDTAVVGDVAFYQLALALIPLSTLLFWLIANTKSLLMPAVMAASGVMIVSLLPILPGDSAQGVTFWLVVGFLWIATVAVAGYYGTDGLDRSIHELPADELPVDWEKIMPRAGSGKKRSLGALNGSAKSRSKAFSAVGRKRK